jgi:flagellar biosynthesis protein FliQ
LGADRALALLSEMLWNGAVVLTPLLGVILVVGVVISILQVATQVQEMTLAYVPKLIAAGLTLILLGGWMMNRIMHFSRDLFLSIPSITH